MALTYQEKLPYNKGTMTKSPAQKLLEEVSPLVEDKSALKAQIAKIKEEKKKLYDQEKQLGEKIKKLRDDQKRLEDQLWDEHGE